MTEHNVPNGGTSPDYAALTPDKKFTEKKPLPGFVKIYLLQTYAILAGLLFLAVAAFLLASWASELAFVGLLVLGAACWPLSCIVSVHKRSRTAAGLCRSLAIGALLLSAVSVVIMIFDGLDGYSYYNLQMLLLLAALLSGLPVYYAWVRYFKISNKVAQAFGLLPRRENAPAAGLAVFRIFCASVLIATLGANLLLSLSSLGISDFFTVEVLRGYLFMWLYCLPQIVFSLLGLILVRSGLPGLVRLGGLGEPGNHSGAGRQSGLGRMGLYRFLGLWIIVCAAWNGVFSYPLFTMFFFEESGEFFTLVLSASGVPLHRNLLPIILLLFLWKFAVSSEDRTWIDAGPSLLPDGRQTGEEAAAQTAGPPETEARGNARPPRKPLSGLLLGAALLLAYVIVLNADACLVRFMFWLKLQFGASTVYTQFASPVRPLLLLILILLAARALYLLLKRKRSAIPAGGAAMIFGLLTVAVGVYLDFKGASGALKRSLASLLPEILTYSAGLYCLAHMRSGEPQNRPPLAVTALQFFCGLTIVWIALPEIIFLLAAALTDWTLNSNPWDYTRTSAMLLPNTLSGLALPIFSIWSVRRANYSRRAVLSTLYLWMAVLLFKLASMPLFSTRWSGGTGYLLPNYESQFMFLGLSAFIWYFHSSNEADEWFSRAPKA